MDHETAKYEVPSVTDLGDLTELTGNLPEELIVDTDPLALGYV